MLSVTFRLALITALFFGVLATKPNAHAQNIPEGFEYLSEPQTTFVDLYFGGNNIGGTLATFTPDTITFDDVTAIVDLLPNLIDKPSVIHALSGPLPPNTDQICLNDTQADCGRLSPQIAGVIFDEGLFRADIFVNVAYLEAATLDDVRFLPRGDDSFAITADLSGSVSGSTGAAQSQTSYQAMTKLIAAQGNQRLEVIGGIASDEKGEIDRIAAIREAGSTKAEAGYIRSSGTALITEFETYGARFQSTTDLRLDLEQTSATPVILFIERRSRVEILRDGRLLSSRTYNAGNQELDISELPDGAYDITVRVFEGATQVNQITEFFVKSRRFPPRDTTLFVAEAGVLPRRNDTRTLPDATSNFFAHAGLSRRIADNIAVNADLYGSEHVASVSGNLIFLARDLNVEVDALVGSDQSIASRLRAAYARPGFSASIDGLWAQDGSYACNTPAEMFDPVEQDEREFTANTSFSVGPVRISGRYEHRARKIAGRFDREDFFLPTVDWTYQPNSRQTIAAALSGRFGEGDSTVFLRLTMRQQDGKWTYSGANRSSFVSSDHDLFDTSTAEVNWRDGLLFDDDIDLGGGVRTQAGAVELFAGGSYIGSRAQAHFDLDHGITDNHVTSYTGSARTGVTFSDGAVSMAGRRQAGSAIVINLEGDAIGAEVVLHINGRSYGTAAVGSRTPIFLPPYDLYKVELAIEGGGNIRFDGRAQQSPLYPGNVVTMTWQVDKIVPLFGQLVDGAGNPLPNRKITIGDNQDYTDEFGFFVIDAAAADQQLIASRKGVEECKITLPTLDFTQDLISLEATVCP